MELVIKIVKMAYEQRDKCSRDLLCQSNQGSQYENKQFRERLCRLGVHLIISLQKEFRKFAD